jgi:ribosomal-protein-alanine N-acetyltransferase
VRASNEAARSLYAKSGFAPIGSRRDYYVEPLEDALVLARALAPDPDLP